MNKLHLILMTLVLNSFASFATKADSVKLSSWNIAWLGSHEYNKRADSDYKALAQYATQLDSDVIALQEVESAKWAKKVFGDEYDYYFTDRDWVQKVGIAVRKSAGLKVTASQYEPLGVGGVRYGMELKIEKGDSELHIMGVHLKSGCFDNPLDAKSIKSMPSKTEREQRRKRACDILEQQIEPLEAWIDDKAAKGKAYIVLGDFNRRFIQDINNKFGEDQGLWQAIDDEGAEQLWAPTINRNSDCWGGYYKDYIDHIVFNPQAKAMLVKNSFEQLVFKEKYTKKLSRNLSDHCPISVEIDM